MRQVADDRTRLLSVAFLLHHLCFVTEHQHKQRTAEWRKRTWSFFIWWIMKEAKRRPPGLCSKFSPGIQGGFYQLLSPDKEGRLGCHIPLSDTTRLTYYVSSCNWQDEGSRWPKLQVYHQSFPQNKKTLFAVCQSNPTSIVSHMFHIFSAR